MQNGIALCDIRPNVVSPGPWPIFKNNNFYLTEKKVGQKMSTNF
jgi:hypothetical protein